MDKEVTKLKTKMLFLLLLISCHKNMSVSKYQYSSQSTVTLPYPNLLWLLSSFGVKLDNGVVPYAPRSPPSGRHSSIDIRYSITHLMFRGLTVLVGE